MTAHRPHRLSSGDIKPFVITVSARALFDLEKDHQVFVNEGMEAFERYQIEHEEDTLAPGPAFPLVKKLLALNDLLPEDAQPIEVILLSRNSPETGLRVFNTIEKMGLPIVRAIFTSGESTSAYIHALDTQLFLSSNPVEVSKAIQVGIGAANITPRPGVKFDSESNPQIRIAFDGDAVLFGDQAELAYSEGGLGHFQQHEIDRAEEPLPDGPFRAFLEKIHELQQLFPGKDCPVRTALVTARAAPAHKRPIKTLRKWGVRVDAAMFMGGRNKGPVLRAFGADMFLDDSRSNINLAVEHDIPSGHVPFGVRNQEGADESKFTGGAQAAALVAQREQELAAQPNSGKIEGDPPEINSLVNIGDPAEPQTRKRRAPGR